MSKEAMKLALEGAANYIDALGGDSRKYRQTLANEALDKMAENARELGLDYEPAPQKPIIKSYLKKDNSQPVKWSDYEPDGMHHNKRPQNCGTGYCSCIECVMEPAQQEPVAWQPLPCPFCGHIGLDFADKETYRWGVASCGGCGASCGDVRREYPDKGEWHTEAIAEWNKRSPAAQRTWVGLTDQEIEQGCKESWVTEQAWQSAVWWAEAILKEKNNG